MTDDEWRLPKRALTGFARLDAKYFMPFFTINLPRVVGFITSKPFLFQQNLLQGRIQTSLTRCFTDEEDAPSLSPLCSIRKS